MDFLVRLDLSAEASASPLAFNNISGFSVNLNIVNFPDGNRQGRKDINFGSGQAVFIGDPVFHNYDPDQLSRDLENGMIGSVIRNTDGFYYLLVIYSKEQKLIISSGSFGILPVFHRLNKDVISVSSSFDILAFQEKDSAMTIDRQYYLEKALFNYPLFNRTPFKEISLLPSNSSLEYSGSGFKIRKHTDICDFLGASPEHVKTSADEMSTLFLEMAEVFIPEYPCMLSLTGGLDSRTVAGVVAGRAEVSGAYTYGLPQDADIKIAAEIADFLKIDFIPVILDVNFTREHFWHHGTEFMRKSYGLGNLSRAHYNFILDNCMGSSRYLMTGNFGSEILRSLKSPGVVTSGALFKLFSSGEGKDLNAELRAEGALDYLNPVVADKSMEGLIGEIGGWLNKLPSRLTVNQKFYVYIFEEVFRKYFGPEIIVQRRSVSHRAPFLCFSFIERVLKTGFAGANSGFMEGNPVKRLQGQVLYSAIIKKTNPALLNFRLDRGYKPADLLSRSGAMRITLEYLKKKYTGRKSQVTPDYLTASMAENMKYFPDIADSDDLFNAGFMNRMKAGGWVSDQMNFINMMSAAVYRNMLHDRSRSASDL
jgi:asparagine synthase (glutamine-hydrolysing)